MRRKNGRAPRITCAGDVFPPRIPSALLFLNLYVFYYIIVLMIFILFRTLFSALRYNRGAIKAVNGLDLTVNAGEIFGFLGPNGVASAAAWIAWRELLTFADKKYSGIEV